MLKSMDPEALASMMSQGGMKITPEQVRRAKHKHRLGCLAVCTEGLEKAGRIAASPGLPYRQ